MCSFQQKSTVFFFVLYKNLFGVVILMQFVLIYAASDLNIRTIVMKKKLQGTKHKCEDSSLESGLFM